ncbi:MULTISPECIES: hypothetical protein [unclassified Burkholderia]|uniref:hypothetical protein n=1 Tax=unclassified Burkholderia TaxID=2613784 RepID=UPI001177BFA2|nr:MULTISPECIES: hypothetical protein [unclassified Burkholderia]
MPFDEKQTNRRNGRTFSNRLSQSVHFDVHCSTPIPDYWSGFAHQSDWRFRSIEFAGFCCYDRLRRALTGGGCAAPRKASSCGAPFGIQHSRERFNRLQRVSDDADCAPVRMRISFSAH